VNRLSSLRPIPRSCWQAALLLLIAVMSGPTLAQKAAPPPPAAPAASPPASGLSLALSQKEALSQRQMLDADTRLDRPVSLDVISVPLDEVLQKESVSKSTDTKPSTDANADPKPAPDRLVLTAAHNCEALKLQIRLNRRPLRTLMTALAGMLPGTWAHTKDGYNLSLTDKAVIARAEWWRLFLGERDKALALQRQAVLDTMQTKARRRRADDPEPAEPTDHVVEEEEANQHDFFHSLPQALKEQIAANMEETAFYDVKGLSYGNGGEQFGTVGWLSQMPPQTQERFKAAMQTNVNRLAQAPPALQGYARQAQRDLAAFNPSKVYFLFQNGGIAVYATPFNGPPSASVPLLLDVPVVMNILPLILDQSRLADIVYGGRLTGPRWKLRADTLRQMGEAASDDQKEMIYEVYGMGEAAPPEWKQLATYQRSRVWPNLLPKLPREDGRPQQFVISRAAQTDWLGEQGHMEYVCDYYSHGGYERPPEQKKLPVKRPLATEMDGMAAKRDVSWKRDADGIVLIRNNRWYRDDGLEVPQPLLRRWFAALLRSRQREVAAQAAIPPVPQSAAGQAGVIKQTWDWAAEVVGALTPWQIHNGLALFQPEEKDLAPQNDATAAKLFEKLKHQVPQPGEVVPPGFDAFTEVTRKPPFFEATYPMKDCPHTVHLYESLDEAGRAALLAGRLPVSALSPGQLTEATSLIPLLPQALQSFPADSVLLDMPMPSEWSPSSRVVFGGVPFTRLAVRTPPAAPPSTP